MTHPQLTDRLERGEAVKAKNETPYDMIMKLKNPDEIFDMICASNYIAGNFKQNIPVEESRKAFERIKKLLRKAKP